MKKVDSKSHKETLEEEVKRLRKEKCQTQISESSQRG